MMCYYKDCPDCNSIRNFNYSLRSRSVNSYSILEHSYHPLIEDSFFVDSIDYMIKNGIGGVSFIFSESEIWYLIYFYHFELTGKMQELFCPKFNTRFFKFSGHNFGRENKEKLTFEGLKQKMEDYFLLNGGKTKENHANIYTYEPGLPSGVMNIMT